MDGVVGEKVLVVGEPVVEHQIFGEDIVGPVVGENDETVHDETGKVVAGPFVRRL